jgi:hypothetical protein
MTLSITTFSTTTLSITTLSVRTFSLTMAKMQHSPLWKSDAILSVIYGVCH